MQIWTALIAMVVLRYLQIAQHLEMELVQSGGLAALSTVRLPRPVELD
jgi:hypothetical protein